MGTSEFIPLSRDGIIRFQVVPETRLSARISQAELRLPELRLQLSGTTVALPDRTPVQVLATAGDPDVASAVTVPLAVPGYKPGVTTPVACSLAATIDLVACGALGRRAVLDLALTPNFPRTAKVPLLEHAVDLECRVSVEAAGAASIGSPVTLTPIVAAALADAQLRLTIKEVDRGEGEAAGAKARDGQPTTQIRWEGGLTAPVEQRRRTWYVGCASESQELEYPHADEAAAYEFTFELEVSFDGETFYPVAGAAPQLTVPRPRLGVFEVAQTELDALEVRAQVEGIDPAFALAVNLELWKVGVKKAVIGRRCALQGGALVEAFTGLKALGCRPGDTVFALLSLAPEAAARPVASASHWLEFDATRSLPGSRYAAAVLSTRLKLAGAPKPAADRAAAPAKKPAASKKAGAPRPAGAARKAAAAGPKPVKPRAK